MKSDVFELSSLVRMVGQTKKVINHCLHLWETCLYKQTPGFQKQAQLRLCKLGPGIVIKICCLNFQGRLHFQCRHNLYVFIFYMFQSILNIFLL